jgi:hypothetical protein
MNNCPKCGGTFGNPFYRRLAHGERLVHTSCTSRYRREALCDDAKSRSNDLMTRARTTSLERRGLHVERTS